MSSSVCGRYARVVRYFLRAFTRVSALTISTIVTVVGIPVTYFIPQLRSWLGSNPLVAWTVTLVLALVVVGMISAMAEVQRDLESRRTSGKAVEGELESLRGKLETAQNELDTTRDQLETTRHRFEATSTSLKAAEERLLEPTEHDRAQARQILQDLPWDSGVMVWLDGSSMKQWSDERSRPLYSLDRRWTEWFFDSTSVQTAFEDLRTSLSELLEWMGSYGFAVTGASELRAMGRTPEEPTLYRLATGGELDGGWAAFDAIRTKGLDLADALVKRRRQFEHVTREARI